MIALTPKAEAHFHKFYNLNKESAFFLTLKKSGCTGYEYKIQHILPERNQNIALICNLPFIIDEQYSDFLYGLIIDVKTIGLSHEINFINPNEKSSCGCGKSISF